MNVEKVESLLERSRPAPPPPDLRRRIVEAAALKVRPLSPSRKPRFVEVMTVAASILMLFATLSWLLREVPPSPTPASQENGQPFEDRRLFDLPSGDGLSDFVWSADGKHWACVTPAGQADSSLVSVVVDGKKETGYSEIRTFRFGADGSYAYIAHDPTRGFVLVVNGAIEREFDSYDQLAWSPDGKKLAFSVSAEGRSFVVVEGKRSQPYDSVWDLMWSPDGRSVAFSARLGQDWFVVVDGKKGEPFDGIRHLTFSPEGKLAVYAANEGAWMMVIDGEKGAEYDAIGAPVFSADGKVVGHTATAVDRQFVVVRPGPVLEFNKCDEVGPPSFSRDGKVWAYRAVPQGQSREQVRICRNKGGAADLQRWEEEGGYYDSVSDPVVSPDGQQVAYAAGKGSRKYLVVGGKATVKFSMIDRICFGPDGRTLAYRAGQYGKQLVVAGNSRGEEFDEVLSGPVWSADGKKVAFTARSGTSLWSRVLEVK